MIEPYWQSDDGRVVLYCADCLEVLPQLASESIDCIVTDPPYGHKNNDAGDLIQRWEHATGVAQTHDAVSSRPIANDGPEANEIFRAVLPEWKRLLKPGSCCCCCCCGGGPDPQFARWSLWLDEVLNFKQMVVWDKGPMGMGWHYRRSYETVLVAEKPGAACKWHDDTDKVENIIRPNYKGIRKIIPSADEHPTPKPVNLASHFIQLHTLPGEVVLDCFAGRAWVGEACVNTGRHFVGIEIDEHWAERAVRRIKDALAQGRLFEGDT